VKEKKYETVQMTSRMLQSTLKIISQTSAIGMKDRLAPAPKKAQPASAAADDVRIDVSQQQKSPPRVALVDLDHSPGEARRAAEAYGARPRTCSPLQASPLPPSPLPPVHAEDSVSGFIDENEEERDKLMSAA